MAQEVPPVALPETTVLPVDVKRRPEAGNQPSWDGEEQDQQQPANQKSGVAKPMKTKTVVALSKREYWRVAENTPIGTRGARG